MMFYLARSLLCVMYRRGDAMAVSHLVYHPPLDTPTHPPVHAEFPCSGPLARARLLYSRILSAAVPVQPWVARSSGLAHCRPPLCWTVDDGCLVSRRPCRTCVIPPPHYPPRSVGLSRCLSIGAVMSPQIAQGPRHTDHTDIPLRHCRPPLCSFLGLLPPRPGALPGPNPLPAVSPRRHELHTVVPVGRAPLDVDCAQLPLPPQPAQSAPEPTPHPIPVLSTRPQRLLVTYAIPALIRFRSVSVRLRWTWRLQQVLCCMAALPLLWSVWRSLTARCVRTMPLRGGARSRNIRPFTATQPPSSRYRCPGVGECADL